MSRRWVQVLVARFLAEGEVGLQPRSRRPHSSPSQVSGDLEEEIICWRKQLAEQGLDAGAETIATHLHKNGEQAARQRGLIGALAWFFTLAPRVREAAGLPARSATGQAVTWITG